MVLFEGGEEILDFVWEYRVIFKNFDVLVLNRMIIYIVILIKIYLVKICKFRI